MGQTSPQKRSTRRDRSPYFRVQFICPKNMCWITQRKSYTDEATAWKAAGSLGRLMRCAPDEQTTSYR